MSTRTIIPKVKPFTRKDALKAFGYRDRPKDKIHLGVELEFEMRPNRCRFETANEVNKVVGDFCLIKNDASLEDGFEVNSAPASLKFHRQAWADFFEHPVREDLLVSKGNCGMHVHVSRKAMKEGVDRRLQEFVCEKANRAFMVDIAGRKNDYYASFRTEGKKTDHRKNPHKYLVVNLSHPNTVEFRLFKSTYNKTIFFYRLEFVQACIEFCNERKTNLNYALFIKFILQNEEKYPNLSQYIKESKKWKPTKSLTSKETKKPATEKRKKLAIAKL